MDAPVEPLVLPSDARRKPLSWLPDARPPHPAGTPLVDQSPFVLHRSHVPDEERDGNNLVQFLREFKLDDVPNEDNRSAFVWMKRRRRIRLLQNFQVRHSLERAITRDVQLPDARKALEYGQLWHGGLRARRIVTFGGGMATAVAVQGRCVFVHEGNNRTASRILDGHSGDVLGLAWLGGDHLVTTGEDGYVITWSANSGKQLSRLQVGTRGAIATAVATVDDTCFLVGMNNGTLISYTHQRGHLVEELRREYRSHKARVWSIAVDGDDVVSVDEYGRGVLSTARTLRPRVRWEHKNAAVAAAVNHKYIVTASLDEIRVRRRREELRNVRKLRGMHGRDVWIHSLTLYDGDKLLSAGGDGCIVAYDLGLEQVLARVQTSLTGVSDTALLADRRLAVCGVYSGCGFVIDMMDVHEPTPVLRRRWSIASLMTKQSEMSQLSAVTLPDVDEDSSSQPSTSQTGKAREPRALEFALPPKVVV